MAKKSFSKRRRNSGRDLKHTETQAQLDVTRQIRNEKGRTDGMLKVGAVSGVSPGLRKRKPSVKRSSNMTADDIRRLPRDAKLIVNQSGKVKMAVYRVDPETLKGK